LYRCRRPELVKSSFINHTSHRWSSTSFTNKHFWATAKRIKNKTSELFRPAAGASRPSGARGLWQVWCHRQPWSLPVCSYANSSTI